MEEIKIKLRANHICYGDAFHLAHGAYLMAVPKNTSNKDGSANVINEKKYTIKDTDATLLTIGLRWV